MKSPFKDSAIPLIEENTSLNSHLWISPRRMLDEDIAQEEVEDVTPPEITIHSRVLDWDEPVPSWVNESPISLVM